MVFGPQCLVAPMKQFARNLKSSDKHKTTVELCYDSNWRNLWKVTAKMCKIHLSVLLSYFYSLILEISCCHFLQLCTNFWICSSDRTASWKSVLSLIAHSVASFSSFRALTFSILNPMCIICFIFRTGSLFKEAAVDLVSKYRDSWTTSLWQQGHTTQPCGQTYQWLNYCGLSPTEPKHLCGDCRWLVKLSTWHKPETDTLIAGAAELYSASRTISAVR